MEFSQVLNDYRASQAMSQGDVVELLSKDSLFANLDVNTYSRWERGSTAPNLTKTVKILYLLNQQDAIQQAMFASLNQKRIEQLEAMIDKRFSPQHPGLSTPFIDALDPTKTKISRLTEQDVQRYSLIHSRCFDEPLASNFNTQNMQGIELCEMFDVNEQIIGHIIYQIVPLNVCLANYSDLLQQAPRGFWHNALQENSQCLHIMSEYSSSTEAFMYRHKIHKDIFLQNRLKIGLSKMYDLAIFQAADKRDSFVFEKGPAFAKGIRWSNGRYRWIKALHRLDQILPWELFWLWDKTNQKQSK
ncbi:helix-turn-helix transcriptional regulator [Vibrio sp. TH_r3]|uniref:helix-turn-helix domain-containing protein n=1 Tax=Vibrio sp. TH_r3 TaxID=3082084 RepID=UPI002953CB85|nr:helix-turn-helix transcriptional regulator [Vibrio sp. TH_r3]MDV7105984.1 helix-turn-helix transcriptional regulator [Vibrio sp. TH_r3]